MFEYAAPDWNGSGFVAVFALAGNHQHKTFALCRGGRDKSRQRRMGLCQGHAVQINSTLRGELPAFHFTKGFSVHLNRRRRQTVMNRRDQIMFQRCRFRFLPNGKCRDRRAWQRGIQYPFFRRVYGLILGLCMQRHGLSRYLFPKFSFLWA